MEKISSKSTLIQGQVLSIFGINRILEIIIQTTNQKPNNFQGQFVWNCGALPLLPGWYVCINGNISNNISMLRKVIKDLIKSKNISTNYSIKKDTSKSDIIYLKFLEDLGIELDFHEEYLRPEEINKEKEFRSQFIIVSEIDRNTIQSELIDLIISLKEIINSIERVDIYDNWSYIAKMRYDFISRPNEWFLSSESNGYYFIDFFKEHIHRLKNLRLIKSKKEFNIKQMGELINKVDESILIENVTNYFDNLKEKLSRIDDNKIYKKISALIQEPYLIYNVTEIFIRYPDNVSELILKHDDECPDNNHYTCPKKKPKKSKS